MPNKQLTIKLLIPAARLSDVLEFGELIEIDVVKKNNKKHRRYATGSRAGTGRNTQLIWTGKNPNTSLTPSGASAHAALTKHMALRKNKGAPTPRHVFVGIVQKELKRAGFKPSSAQPLLTDLVRSGYFKIANA